MSTQPLRYAVDSRDDLNALRALFADNLANFVMVAVLTKFVLGIPDAINDAHGAGVDLASPEMVSTMLTKGVHFVGQNALSQGAIISGLIWGGMTVLLIDLRLRAVAGFAAGASVCSLLGLIHAPALGWNPGAYALGYGIMAVVFGALSLGKVETTTVAEADDEP
jgi:hypothetical protein